MRRRARQQKAVRLPVGSGAFHKSSDLTVGADPIAGLTKKRTNAVLALLLKQEMSAQNC